MAGSADEQLVEVLPLESRRRKQRLLFRAVVIAVGSTFGALGFILITKHTSGFPSLPSANRMEPKGNVLKDAAQRGLVDKTPYKERLKWTENMRDWLAERKADNERKSQESIQNVVQEVKADMKEEYAKVASKEDVKKLDDKAKEKAKELRQKAYDQAEIIDGILFKTKRSILSIKSNCIDSPSCDEAQVAIDVLEMGKCVMFAASALMPAGPIVAGVMQVVLSFFVGKQGFTKPPLSLEDVQNVVAGELMKIEMKHILWDTEAWANTLKTEITAVSNAVQYPGDPKPSNDDVMGFLMSIKDVTHSIDAVVTQLYAAILKAVGPESSFRQIDLGGLIPFSYSECNSKCKNGRAYSISDSFILNKWDPQCMVDNGYVKERLPLLGGAIKQFEMLSALFLTLQGAVETAFEQNADAAAKVVGAGYDFKKFNTKCDSIVDLYKKLEKGFLDFHEYCEKEWDSSGKSLYKDQFCQKGAPGCRGRDECIYGWGSATRTCDYGQVAIFSSAPTCDAGGEWCPGEEYGPWVWLGQTTGGGDERSCVKSYKNVRGRESSLSDWYLQYSVGSWGGCGSWCWTGSKSICARPIICMHEYSQASRACTRIIHYEALWKI